MSNFTFSIFFTSEEKKADYFHIICSFMLEAAPQVYSWTRQGLITVIQFHFGIYSAMKAVSFLCEICQMAYALHGLNKHTEFTSTASTYWREHVVMWLYYLHMVFKSNQSPDVRRCFCWCFVCLFWQRGSTAGGGGWGGAVTENHPADNWTAKCWWCVALAELLKSSDGY